MPGSSIELFRDEIYVNGSLSRGMIRSTDLADGPYSFKLLAYFPFDHHSLTVLYTCLIDFCYCCFLHLARTLVLLLAARFL
jgi:hypothetical protein